MKCPYDLDQMTSVEIVKTLERVAHCIRSGDISLESAKRIHESLSEIGVFVDAGVYPEY